MPDMILESLTHAADRLTDPAVHQAYQQLARALGITLTGQPFTADQPFTPTQLVLLDHALRRLSPAQLTVLRDSAVQLEATLTLTLNVDTLVQQRIGTVSGGSVTMIGVQNHAAPESAPAAPHGIPVDWACDVFISYSRKDSTAARRLYADLRAAGLLVWLDDALTPGTPSWQNALETAIRSAGCVAAVLTPAAKASEWVEREISVAQRHRIPVVPLILAGDDVSSLPLSLSSTQWTCLRNPREYRANLPKVIAAIKAFNA
jgi:hypothetical protein